MSRYIRIEKGMWEGFCGIITDRNGRISGFCSVLTEYFGEKVFISARVEWVVDIATLDPWQKAQETRLKEFFAQSAR
jgi:hypothetical protein